MPRYVAKVQYDGSRYHGYQIQKNGTSIQERIEHALLLIAKRSPNNPIKIVGSGRTDAGVHALGQVIHFDFPASIPATNLLRALNSILAKDIRIVQCKQIESDFHARYDAIGKSYRYRVDIQRFPDPFKRQFTTHHGYPFKIERIQAGLAYLKGEHDFTSFCSTKTDKQNKVRNLYQIEANIDSHNQELVFDFRGNGFLYNMIRIIVGTSLQIGDGLKQPEEMQRLLQVKDRNQAGPTAPPQGLYLMHVEYKEDPFDSE
ncbi:tRNA pseudouridine(38-40) synthase TruA [Facklamia miroungae]|uniref:tRNA pseudouridine synthase A n=1 Tax=Facklamia miroungae TaxID=120956 RepID=A0A1G7RKH5_9LACT|nr:tRNA pseudouridine(38-40) synthase TruA [Facklamia miroungae]NKZ29381.1 tRNA pseudouridine(38-40) synthase TruA [Facklamia miroungae]SDG11213.1 tRNA pseudouridine38-40 synthase [Facklamia miroungae]